MGKPQKILTTGLWILAVMGMLLFLALSSANRNRKQQASMQEQQKPQPSDASKPLFELPKFKLLNQDGKEFTDDQLRGKPFVACFVFTHCAGPCPMMFGKMAKMQATVPNPNVKLVSFTVDPERDTPAVLKEKAKELGAEDGRWFFLTGDKDSVQKVLRDMLQPKPQEGDDPLMHDTHFYLFDKNGSCVARYSINDADEMAKLAKDADALAK